MIKKYALGEIKGCSKISDFLYYTVDTSCPEQLMDFKEVMGRLAKFSRLLELRVKELSFPELFNGKELNLSQSMANARFETIIEGFEETEAHLRGKGSTMLPKEARKIVSQVEDKFYHYISAILHKKLEGHTEKMTSLPSDEKKLSAVLEEYYKRYGSFLPREGQYGFIFSRGQGEWGTPCLVHEYRYLQDKEFLATIETCNYAAFNLFIDLEEGSKNPIVSYSKFYELYEEMFGEVEVEKINLLKESD